MLFSTLSRIALTPLLDILSCVKTFASGKMFAKFANLHRTFPETAMEIGLGE